MSRGKRICSPPGIPLLHGSELRRCVRDVSAIDWCYRVLNGLLPQNLLPGSPPHHMRFQTNSKGDSDFGKFARLKRFLRRLRYRCYLLQR